MTDCLWGPVVNDECVLFALTGVIVSMTWPCYYDDIMLGIVGLDVPLGDIVESATYFRPDKSTYAFVMDREGRLTLPL